MKRILSCALAACVGMLVPGSLGALDLTDFLDLETSDSMAITAEATIGGIHVNLTGYMTVMKVPSLFEDEAEATRIEYVLTGGKYMLTQSFILRYKYPNLLIEDREATFYYDNYLIDYDEETYLSPAVLLPRMFEMDTEYDYTAELETGTVACATRVKNVVSHGTGHATNGEGLNIVLFANDHHSLYLCLCRTYGIVGMSIDHTFGRVHVSSTIDVEIDDTAWPPETVCGMWDSTINLGEGWRFTPWFGIFCIHGINDPWVFHYGLGDTYCYGDSSSMWIWFPDGEWMWTQDNLYPVFWSYVYKRYLLYLEGPGSHTFYDYSTGGFINL